MSFLETSVSGQSKENQPGRSYDEEELVTVLEPEIVNKGATISIYLIFEGLSLVDPRIDLAGSKVLTVDSAVD